MRWYDYTGQKDFDGDCINFMLAMDNFVAKEYENLAPHKSTFNLDKPFTVSDNLSMPKPVIATISNWLHYDLTEEDTDPVKINNMNIIQEIV